jgi:shikimate dehydrogenase
MTVEQAFLQKLNQIMNKDTNICISIASIPGDFGAYFHNEAYKALGLNWAYIPRKVSDISELKSVITSVRSLDITGCSVSMPLKERVIDHIDDLDLSAKKTGAVNTILNRDGFLTGFNTDLYGAKKSLSNFNLANKEVLVIGAGGVSKAIANAVLELDGIITIVNRTNKTSEDLSKKLNVKFLTWDKLNSLEGYMLINTTSVGMCDENQMIVSEKTIDRFEVIMDVVVDPRLSKLIRISSAKGKYIIRGIEMCVYQAAEQFKIYTGKDAPQELIDSILDDAHHG